MFLCSVLGSTHPPKDTNIASFQTASPLTLFSVRLVTPHPAQPRKWAEREKAYLAVAGRFSIPVFYFVALNQMQIFQKKVIYLHFTN